MLESICFERIRYGMTDKMGVMYYGNYSMLYEIGRVELMRDIGILYSEMENNQKIGLPVTDLTVKFIKPARYDEKIKVVTRLSEMPSWNISFVHELYNEENVLINKAEVNLVFYDMINKKVARCPDNLKEALKDYFG